MVSVKPMNMSEKEFQARLDAGKNTLIRIQSLENPISYRMKLIGRNEKLHYSFRQPIFPRVYKPKMLSKLRKDFNNIKFEVETDSESRIYYCVIKLKVNKFESLAFRIYNLDVAYLDLKLQYKHLIREKLDYHAPHITDNILSFIM